MGTAMEGTLLAVDVGMRAGLAWFGTDGRLLHSRSARFASRAVLRRAVPAILAERPPVRLVVLEGMGPVADIWMRSLERLGVPFEQVSAETWREAMLLRRERRSGEQAKQHAARLAAPLLAGTGHPRPEAIGDDEAEAILCGLWAVRALLPSLSRPVRGPSAPPPP